MGSASKRFAGGAKAWGECQRSGNKYLLKDLVEDGHIPGILVHRSFYEPPHPRETVPIPSDDPQALYRPSPRTDRESAKAHIDDGLNLLTNLEVRIPVVSVSVMAPAATGAVSSGNMVDAMGNNVTDAMGNNVILAAS